MKRRIWVGLGAGVVMLVVGIVLSSLFSVFFPSLQAEYENGSIFRPWSDPLMLLYFLYPFVLGLILSWVWSYARTLKEWGSGAWQQGLRFGFIFWIILTIPGMLITYSSFQVSLGLVFSWTVVGFIELVAAGVVLARFGGRVS